MMKKLATSGSFHLMLAGLIIAGLFIQFLNSPAVGAAVNLDVVRNGKVYYQFETQDGDSLSRLARTAILCFTNEYAGQSFSDEQLVYTETRLVDILGRRPLQVGEKVVITSQQISDILLSSQSLSPQSLKRWRAYSQRIDYQSARQAVQALLIPDRQPATSSETSSPSDSSASGEQQTPAYWWYIATIECLLIFWIIFRR